ncbi:MAG: zinc-binding dehydrogenase [Chloroflexota bacterium]
MKAVHIYERGKARIVETAVPTLKSNHALIRTHRISLCASDVYMLRYALDERYPYPIGATGHEIIGYVEAMDGEHPTVGIGEPTLVIVPDQTGMCEYVVAPFENVLPLPKNAPFEHLVQAQQLGTVIYACKQLPNLIGKDVAVVGQGSAGMWFDVMLKRLGAKRIVAVDLQAHRLAVSSHFGATHTVHNKGMTVEETQTAVREALGGNDPDVVVEAAGETHSINLAIELAKVEGFMLQFGVPHQDKFVVNYSELFRKRLTLKAIVYASLEEGHTSTLAALDMIAKGEIDVTPILTHTFPFEQVLDAYELQATYDEGNIKIIVEMPDGA